jgi:antitoxin MazE
MGPHVRVRRWGNSLALRIPKTAAEQARLAEGATVTIRAETGRLLVRRAHRYRLRDLLARVQTSQLHGEIPTGPAVGREAW